MCVHVRYRPHRLLVRTTLPDGDVLIGRGFSAHYLRASAEAADAVFGHGASGLVETLRRVSGASEAQVRELFAVARRADLLVRETEDEMTPLLARAEEDHLEAEVGTPGVWTATRDFYVGFLLGSGLKRGHRLLDVGCGNLRIGLPIIEYLDYGRYAGLDVRTGVLDQARARIDRGGLAAKAPLLCQSDIFTHSDLGGRLFDIIIAFQLFYHLTNSELDLALETLCRHLVPSGRLFANVQFARDRTDAERPGSWRGFPFLRRPADAYVRAADRAGLSLTNLGPLHSLGYDRYMVGAENSMLMLRRKPEHR